MRLETLFDRILKKLFFFFSVIGLLHQAHGQFTNADRYFSPNLDGVKDFIEIPLTIEEENLEKWSLTIVRKQGKVFKRVMTYESINPKEERLSFTKFFSRLIAKDTPLKAPNSFLWEGRDKQGNLVEDGIYYFTLSALDTWGNESKSPLFPIVVDTVTPQSELNLTTDIFSPNGDSRKDTIPFVIDSKEFSPQDVWTLTITDLQGKLVKEFSSSLPKTTLAWDGNGDDGKPVPAGSYLVNMVTKDLAGNSSQIEERKIFLVREFEKIGLEISQNIFSPNQDGFFDNVSFETHLSSLEGMEKWNLEIKNQAGTLVKSFGDTPLRKVIFYEGNSDQGEILPDGEYISQFRAWFRSGNQPNSSPIRFTIDTQAPVIGIELRNQILNPNAVGAGYKNLSVKNDYDLSETNLYQITILKQNGDPVLKRDYLSKHPPREFLWNGKNEKGQILAGKYVYVFKAKDEVENVSSVISEPFEVIDDSIDLSVDTDNSSLSPNGDGQLDAINFRFKINERYRNILIEGKLTIYDQKQQKVKEFVFTKFPNTLTWDGLVDPKFSDLGDNKNLPALPDGVYVYTLTAKFQTQEDISLSAKNIYLDNTPVKLVLMPHENIFSPNGDGNKDRILFSNQHTTSALRADQDQFRAVIYKKQGSKEVVYRRKEWKGNFPNHLLWSGEDQVGGDSPQGVYQMRIETIDHAFNRKNYLSKPFTLVREIEKLDLEVYPTLLTAVSEGDPHRLTIKPTLSSSEGLQGISYTLFLTNEKKVAFSRKSDATPVEWDLVKQKQVESQVVLYSGLYYLQAHAEYESGNSPESPIKGVFVDNDYPTVTVNTQPLFFSPDGDGVNDELSLRIIAQDNYGIEKIAAEIFLKENAGTHSTPEKSYRYYRQRQIPLKSWTWDVNSKKFDDAFTWNGRDDLGTLVESATDYVIFVRAQDQVGLPVIVEHSFLVDILVERLADGRLRIILNNINFKYNSDEMVGNYEKVLNLLIRMLGKFPEYNIHLVGHTDSRGSDEYNDALSVKRAVVVQNYLANRGKISVKRLTSEGKGEQELLIPNEKQVDDQFTGEIRKTMIEENYRKNRRVEFFLKKKD